MQPVSRPSVSKGITSILEDSASHNLYLMLMFSVSTGVSVSFVWARWVCTTVQDAQFTCGELTWYRFWTQVISTSGVVAEREALQLCISTTLAVYAKEQLFSSSPALSTSCGNRPDDPECVIRCISGLLCRLQIVVFSAGVHRHKEFSQIKRQKAAPVSQMERGASRQRSNSLNEAVLIL